VRVCNSSPLVGYAREYSWPCCMKGISSDIRVNFHAECMRRVGRLKAAPTLRISAPGAEWRIIVIKGAQWGVLSAGITGWRAPRSDAGSAFQINSCWLRQGPGICWAADK